MQGELGRRSAYSTSGRDLLWLVDETEHEIVLSDSTGGAPGPLVVVVADPDYRASFKTPNARESEVAAAPGGTRAVGLGSTVFTRIPGTAKEGRVIWALLAGGTRDVRITFYKRLLAGESREAALRATKLDMLKSPRAHPYYWASFVETGAWTPLPVVSK